MKIIFTTHTYYPNKDGVAVVNDYLTRGLVRKGYKIVVITHQKDSLVQEENYSGIKIYRAYNGDSEQYLNFIKSILDDDDVLINVCMQTPTTDVLLPHLNELKCYKKILYVHGIWNFKWNNRDFENLHNILSKTYNNAKWRMYYHRFLKFVKEYDIVTQLHEMDDGNLFFKKHFNIDSVIMENAADDAFFEKDDDSAFRIKHNIKGDYLISVANYGKGKNQEMVLRAYYGSSATQELVFIGKDSGDYIRQLENIESELRNNNESDGDVNNNYSSKKVHYLKDIPREEIPFFVRNAKLFLFGSIGEKFPVSIVESMAAGVPFISTDVGIVRYFPGGITVKINDVQAMSDNIDLLLSDKYMWRKLSMDGRRYASDRMRISDKIDQFEELLK